MKIALLGYGKMGHMIDDLASEHGLEVIEKYDVGREIKADESTKTDLMNVPVFIDFSIPDVVFENIRIAAELKKHLVIGTTGWHDHLGEVEDIVKNNDIGLVYASNFSLGINLFYKVVAKAAGLFAAFQDYDCYVEEAHHQFKLDAPSGTAISIRKILEEQYKTKECPVTSVRAGYIPGTHSVGFDSKADTVQLKHTARSREGFALGAIMAAKWIEQRKGMYAFSDILDNILKSSVT